MKKYFAHTLTALCLSLLTAHAATTIRYVDVNNSSPAAPYTSWATAAADIQSAVDAANAGDQILVTNGVYATGGRPNALSMTNRVLVNKVVTVQSVNGPEVTLIQGYQVPGTKTGTDAVRCAYLADGVALIGFTLANGATKGGNAAGDKDGGGIYCAGSSSVVSNCVVTGSMANFHGGGVYRGQLYNCRLAGNSASEGGAAWSSKLDSCTIVSNTSSSFGGGVSGGTLTNCTLTGNSAPQSSGGGAYLATIYSSRLIGNTANQGGGANACTLYDCVLLNNSALSGGGSFQGTLNNCALSGNAAATGGGAYLTTMNNCTITGNRAFATGGGVSGCSLYNCIVYFNTVGNSPNNSDPSGGGVMYYCCSTPLPPAGIGNFTSDPQLADIARLSPGSPCRGAGSGAYATGLDLDGEPWSNPPSVGCDEYVSGGQTGLFTAAIGTAWTNVTPGFQANFTAIFSGRVTNTRWEFDDGSVLSNHPYASHGWAGGGDYPVQLRAYNDSNPEGVVAAIVVHVGNGVHFVAVDSANPVAPYDSWATAANNIQDAVDAGFAGGTVVVSNGTYSTGGRAVSGVLLSRVAVTKPLTLQSVHGPEFTVIEGYQVPVVKFGDTAARCVYLGEGALLAGFTLTQGATRSSAFFTEEWSGGGVWCQSVSSVISNCVLTGNAASAAGGGAYQGTLRHCTLSGNSVQSSIGGGGAAFASLIDCIIANNSGPSGGGVKSCALTNCLVTGNSGGQGGGINLSTAVNCTLAGNSATVNAGGAYGGTLLNCILQYNTSVTNDNYFIPGTGITLFSNCCTFPLPPTGLNNFTNPPLFADLAGGDLRLLSNSPCINAGNSLFVLMGLDLSGNARVAGSAADVGAYEFQSPLSVLPYAWLQQYGLPMDGSADNADSDGDGFVNWQEWRAGTNPTNAASCLRLLSPTPDPSGLVITWPSVSGITYFLDRSAGLLAQPAFQTIGTNLPGLAGTTSFADTNAAGPGPWFYRVGVQ